MNAETVTPTISGAEARRAARNAGAIAAASIASKGLLFGWQLLLAPWLGPAAYGVYGAVGAFVAVASSIPNFGMGPIVIRDVARQPEQAGKYLTSTLVMQTGLALLAYLGLNVAAAALGYSETIRQLAALAGLSLIVDILGNMCNDLMLAQERMVASSGVAVGHIMLLVLLVGTALWSGYGLVGLYAATLGAGLVRSALLWTLVLRGGVRPVWPFDRAVAWPLLLNGAPLAMAAFLSLAYQHADKLLTARLLGERSTGYLTAAFVVIFGVVELMSTTILTATYPLMSRAYGDGNDPTFGFIVEKLALFTLLATLPVSLVLSLFAGDLTAAVVPEFGTTAEVLRVLIWYALVAMAANVFAQGMMAQNRQGRLLGIRATGLAVNIVLLLALLPRVGVQGAALASLLAETLVLGLIFRSFGAAGWTWRRLLPRVGRLALLGVLIAMAMWASGRVHPIVGILGGLALYPVGVVLLRVLAGDDLDLLYRLIAAMPGGALVRRYWRREVKLNW